MCEEKYILAIQNYVKNNYKKMFREAEGNLKYKFIVPGSCYGNCLWDWDSWLTDMALEKIANQEEIFEYQKGCILNFLDYADDEGRIPIMIGVDEIIPEFEENMETNVCKPVLAQHAWYVAERHKDVEWIRKHFDKLDRYIQYYVDNCRHTETGLYYWIDDCAIGVDNDPCTFFRPNRSSGSIFLNCLMYKELLAAERLATSLNRMELSEKYKYLAEQLRWSVQQNCWDEKDGFFYSVDLNLLPICEEKWLHSGGQRHWNCLIQRIGVWSGFLALWSGIATKEQAERIVREHYLNEKSFCAPYGVRSLSKQEKMYAIVKSGNPSCWLGPVWGISNYMVFCGLEAYGFEREAEELTAKTICLFGRDIIKNGEMHEYYDPETGTGIINQGFQSWNLLVLNMIEWFEQRKI